MKGGMGWPLLKCMVNKCNVRRAMMKKIGGDKEGHLGFGDVIARYDWHHGGVNGSMRNQ